MGRFRKFLLETQAPGIGFEPIHTSETVEDGYNLIKYIDAIVNEYIKDSSKIIPLESGRLDDFKKYLVQYGHPLAHNKTLNDEQLWSEFIKERALTKSKSELGFSSFSSNPWARQTSQWYQYF
jgi:hypothetical protein